MNKGTPVHRVKTDDQLIKQTGATPPGFVKLSYEIDRALANEFRGFCFSHGIVIKAAMAEAIEMWLEDKTEGKR
jgi:hypothetical protein